ncbi:MAG TPA: c-type cytochrome [Xanthomonadales bacterium]|nr:c-type cytochrome [Xanthomonadales bacterium]
MDKQGAQSVWFVALFTGLCLVSAEGRSANAEALLQTCKACHNSTGPPLGPEIPIIAGQPFTTIEDALILFSRDERPCTVMCDLAKTLSDDEKEVLGNALEQQAFLPADQPFDAARAAIGAELHQRKGCETCHSEGGRNGHGVAPILAGQRTPYLRTALDQIRNGQRKGPKVMNDAIATLDDEEIEALLNFYASHD